MSRYDLSYCQLLEQCIAQEVREKITEFIDYLQEQFRLDTEIVLGKDWIIGYEYEWSKQAWGKETYRIRVNQILRFID